MKSMSVVSQLAFAALVASPLAACSSSPGTLANFGTSPATAGTFSVRAIAGSPDAGPVDVYVFATTGSQPATPLFANVQYPGITAYVSLPTTSYTIAFDRAGTLTQLETETLGGTTSGSQVTAALAGQAGAGTLQLQNFTESSETSGTSALLVHHASPAVDAKTSPIGFGAYDANGAGTPGAAFTSQLFTFALAPATTLAPGSSGPATSGAVTGGEYFDSPIATTLPSPLGFAIGAPGNAGALATVVASSSLSGLANNLSTNGYGRSTLAQSLAADSANTLPAGGHISVFLVDSTTSAPAVLIGTFDP